ncbi:MAG: glycosyltransferase family 9 protein [Candidatus Delongbacteria bacterium]|nr:glycosyltransferase family 9 protein [Candidatus Delongbacteria bacterium]
MQNDLKKILVVRKFKLGDSLLFTPVMEALHHRYPGIKIDLITGSEFGLEFWRHYPYIGRIWNENDLYTRPNWRERWAFLRSIRRRHYDAVLVSSMETGYALKAFLMGIPKRYGFGRAFYYSPGWDRWKWLYTDHLDDHEPREVQRNLQLLKFLGIESNRTELSFYPEPEARLRLLGRIESIPWNHTVIISLVGHSPGRSLPMELWEKIGPGLVFPEGWGAVLIGTSRDYQANLAYARLLNVPFLNLAGKTDLSELFYLIKASRGLISVDSGIMHLATIPQIPMFIIWGPGNEQVFSPLHYSSSEIHLFNSVHTCGPCQEPCPDLACYHRIDPNQIVQSFNQWIIRQHQVLPDCSAQ